MGVGDWLNRKLTGKAPAAVKAMEQVKHDEMELNKLIQAEGELVSGLRLMYANKAGLTEKLVAVVDWEIKRDAIGLERLKAWKARQAGAFRKWRTRIGSMRTAFKEGKADITKDIASLENELRTIELQKNQTIHALDPTRARVSRNLAQVTDQLRQAEALVKNLKMQKTKLTNVQRDMGRVVTRDVNPDDIHRQVLQLAASMNQLQAARSPAEVQEAVKRIK
ncbi:TPA: hypothetical protein HA239_02730 [Candidatus Woesearchaeota archaeon]|nr:hypothetical protein QT06_C0001G1146 [archaeon GW2011_AR15]MBS3104383.1 hypothetical protein [Candidatus Woesearchaeota archaeon]HIH41304.1 hypothetical protein [Candidatus Woesearchaeota archaeon]